MTLQATDIPALFELAKTGDVSARDRLSDAAGRSCGLAWEDQPYPFGRNWYVRGDGVLPVGAAWEAWRIHGRHAPLVSLDCAASVPLPVGWAMDIELLYTVDGVSPGVHVYRLSADVDPDDGLFEFTDPAHRALAECCARLWAVAHYNESKGD